MTIPRCLHQIWLGSDSPPAQYERYSRSWQKHHPGWQYKLWTDANLPFLVNRMCFDKSRALAGKANVLRYEILLQFGGVYVDMDFECQRNIETLIDGTDCFAARQSDRIVNNAIIGTSPEHPFLSDLVNSLPAHFSSVAPATPSVRESGPFYFTRILERHPEVRILPSELFYPYAWHERWRRSEFFPKAFAVHHWTLSGRGADVPQPRRVGDGLRPAIDIALLLSPASNAVRLRWVFEGLCAQTASDFNVFVVDPCGGATNRDLVAAYRKRLTLYHLTPAEWAIGSPSASVLCGLALEQASCHRLLLLDGRCIPDPALIEHHASFGAESVAPFGFRRIYPRDKLYDFVAPLDYTGMALHSFEDPRRSPGSTLFGDWRDVQGFSLSAPTEALRAIKGLGGAKYTIDFPDIARQLSANGCRLRPLWTESYVTYLD